MHDYLCIRKIHKNKKGFNLNLIAGIKAGWRTFWGAEGNAEGWVSTGSDPYFDSATFNEEKYLAISSYFACIRNISEDVGKLPFILYERLDRGKRRATEHDFYQIIRYRPAKPITSTALRETLIRSALAWGNGYARIFRKNGGDPALIYPLNPAHVKPQDDGNGGLQYKIKKGSRDPYIIPGEDMIHVHGVGSNGVTGMSVASYAQR